MKYEKKTGIILFKSNAYSLVYDKIKVKERYRYIDMIRFGIVGAGGIAEKFASDIKFAKNAKGVAIASRNIDKAIEFKNQFDLEYAFGSYQEMAKSDLIDAVYIATPHNFHKEQAILFMNHKKHVLCEKPIAVNKDEFEEMVICAKKE